MKFILTLIIVITFSTSVLAEELIGYDPVKAWVAPPVGGLVGFGTGHALQDRYSDYAWAYTVADSVGFFLIVLTLGDCPEAQGTCQQHKNTVGGAGQTVLVVSRLAQVIDTSFWAHKYYNKYRTQTFFMPRHDGAALVYSLNF